MSDSISNPLAISPSPLAGLGAITPLAFDLLTPGPATALASTPSGSSVLVQLSSTGQLLAAVSSFRSRLEALQSSSLDANPPTPLAQAQGLVDAFNDLQGSIGRWQTTFGALAGSLSVDSLALTLNQLATTAVASGSSSLASLSPPGLELTTAVSPQTGGTGFVLRLNQEVFSAAQAANPAATQALLAGSIQGFIEPLAGFEAQAASAAIVQTRLSQLGTATSGQALDLNSFPGLNTGANVQGIGGASDLLQLLSADNVLNGIQLSDPDLAASGLDAATLLSSNVLRQTLLASTLLVPAGTANPPGSAESLPPAAGEALLATAARPAIAERQGNPALAVGPAPALVSPLGLTGQAVAALPNDGLVAERAATEATLALRKLLDDPSLKAISNNRFDPAYAALIAATHLSDFVLPSPSTNPGSPSPDVPAPVSSVALARAIGEYQEAARDYRGAYGKP